MTAREHIADFHRKAQEHHNEMEKCHANLSKCFSSLHKESGMSDKESPHAKIAAHHERLAALHKSHAEYHEQAANGCAKAADSPDLNKRAGLEIIRDEVRKALDTMIVPMQVSGVTPDNPHFRPVTRTGQRELTPVERPPVPLELEKILAIE